jgi:hypothetical protein
MPDRPDVDVRLAAVKFLFSHRAVSFTAHNARPNGWLCAP